MCGDVPLKDEDEVGKMKKSEEISKERRRKRETEIECEETLPAVLSILNLNIDGARRKNQKR